MVHVRFESYASVNANNNPRVQALLAREACVCPWGHTKPWWPTAAIVDARRCNVCWVHAGGQAFANSPVSLAGGMRVACIPSAAPFTSRTGFPMRWCCLMYCALKRATTPQRHYAEIAADAFRRTGKRWRLVQAPHRSLYQALLRAFRPSSGFPAVPARRWIFHKVDPKMAEDAMVHGRVLLVIIRATSAGDASWRSIEAACMAPLPSRTAARKPGLNYP